MWENSSPLGPFRGRQAAPQTTCLTKLQLLPHSLLFLMAFVRMKSQLMHKENLVTMKLPLWYDCGHTSHICHIRQAGRWKKNKLEERLDNKAECAICSLAGEEVTHILFTLEKWFEGFGAGARECGNQVMATFAKDASHIMRPRFRFLCYAVETQRKDKKKLICYILFIVALPALNSISFSQPSRILSI